MTYNKKKGTYPTKTSHIKAGFNQSGRDKASAYLAEIDGVSIKKLTERFGSPLFILSERQLRENVRRLLHAFQTRYPKVIYGWSYKTNYLGAVCQIFHQEGAWAEVVSAFEYEKARALGVPGNRIIFNGPLKERTILAQAVNEGARIHIDNLDELYTLEAIGAANEKIIPVAIRLNFDTGFTESWCRFGFNIENGQALEVAQRISESAYLELCGLHSHIGTSIFETRAYEAQVRIMCAFMETVEIKTGCEIESLDIGGGFASPNIPRDIALSSKQVVPEIEDYAQVICDTLLEVTRERVACGKPQPTLILESGRAMVDNAGSLITRVIATKNLPDGRRSAVLDAGVNLLFTGFLYNHRIELAQESQGVWEDTVLYGPLCMNTDIIRSRVSLPPLHKHDRLVIMSVGAYNNTQWLQFIAYRPNVVMVHDAGDVSVIRVAEDLQAMTAQERLPDHLKRGDQILRDE